jgi:hypothetical protein
MLGDERDFPKTPTTVPRAGRSDEQDDCDDHGDVEGCMVSPHLQSTTISPPSVEATFPQASLHCVPGAHSRDFCPLQLMTHAVVPPHTTVHPLDPAHSALQPPLGQSMVQVLSPSHVTVEPVSRLSLQALPPVHVT